MSDWNSGPDQLCPANGYITASLTEAVKLRYNYNNEELYPLKPLSIYTVFKERVRKTPSKEALVVKQNGQNVVYTYEQYWNLSHKAAKSFIKLGLVPGQSVSVLGFNSPEWMLSLYGSIFAGGVVNGIYTTNSPDICEFIINDSNTRIVVVENNDQLRKILKIKQNCNITKIIQYSGDVSDSHNGLVISWNQFIELGNNVSDEEVNNRIRKLAPNKCASLIYTSGTTGMPKAAMLSHDNIRYAAQYVIDSTRLREACERVVSFLPLSHIAAQLVDCFISVIIGATVYFAQPDAMKGSLNATLLEVKPTCFFAVPRVWEKIEEKLMQMAKSGAKVPPEKVKHLIGLGEAHALYSGGAPIKKSTLKFFVNFGLVICEVYGMSESAGPHTVGFSFHNTLGSAGYTLSQFYRTRINSPDADGNGEICMYGRNVFMGYLNNEKKTHETIDPNGWLLSGDIGKIDKYDFLYITGRIKELIITAGGENISPIPIEDAIVGAEPNLISNCMVIGDHKNYLTVLVALKAKLDPNTTASLDDLSDEAILWLKNNGSSKTKLSQILSENDEIVNKGIQNAIDKANEKSISNAAKVRKFTILPRDFSIATGELGPTLKLRRPILLKMYEKLIEKMYS